MHLTATTSTTTTGAAGNSDPKDAESTLDMSGRPAALRARSAAATRPGGADVTA
ncbi:MULTISPECIES: hypothetical protein [Rhodococcus]|uniref:hypothetical protein n=1 Tax=Rhodococcus TaxID=1827 RepID=UPI000ACAA261|nr:MULTISPECIES: hypothetical protein [Rhodococcus]